MIDFEAIKQAVMKGKRKDVKELVEAALTEGAAPEDILNNSLLAAMEVIGEKFKKDEVFVPEVLISARAMKMGVTTLQPYMKAETTDNKIKVAVGTVRGDLHDIGKNLVVMMLDGAGYEVVDLGNDVAPERYVEAAEEGAQVIGMSALLTTTMGEMKTVIDLFEEKGMRSQVKIIVGGAPITQDYADKIGADGYSADAASAVDLVASFFAS